MTKRTKKPTKSMLELIPYRNISEEGYIQLSDGSYMDLLQIIPRSIVKINADERGTIIERYAQVFRGYKNDCKLIIMNYPTDTTTARRNIELAIERTNNQQYLHFLETKITELNKITSNIPTCEYYLMLFGVDHADMQRNIDTATTLMNNALSTTQFSIEKKIKILRKLCDANSIITEV